LPFTILARDQPQVLVSFNCDPEEDDPEFPLDEFEEYVDDPEFVGV